MLGGGTELDKGGRKQFAAGISEDASNMQLACSRRAVLAL